VHWPALKVPGPLEPKLTVPVGVPGVPVSVSVTVAVHVVGAATATGSGVQLTFVEVERWGMTVRNVDPRLRMLPACLASPPYWAMIVCALPFMGRALGV
jgi:hypothetical protein